MNVDRLAAILGAAVALLTAGAAGAAPVVDPTPVPEPATLAVMAAGVGVLAWVKFRGRQ